MVETILCTYVSRMKDGQKTGQGAVTATADVAHDNRASMYEIGAVSFIIELYLGLSERETGFRVVFITG